MNVTAYTCWNGFLEETGFLEPLQSGFRPGFWTETALFTLSDDLGRDIDRESAFPLILLDLLVAFDTTDHAMLLEFLFELSVWIGQGYTDSP